MNWLSRVDLRSIWVRRLVVVLYMATSFYLLATLARLFLPSESVEAVLAQPVNYYRNYPFDRAFGITDAPREAKADPVAQSQQVYQLTALKVKGIYAESDGGGFVVVEEGRSVHFINRGESFKGYRLERVEARRALFDREGRQYELKLAEAGPQAQVTPARAPRAGGAQRASQQSDTQQLMRNVPRAEIDRYRQDARLIWDNIGILPVTENGDFKEFRVTFVATGSVFEQLGLQAGDVLKEANGIVLDGYAAALRLYAEIDRMESFRLVIERNNQTRELEYEIR